MKSKIILFILFLVLATGCASAGNVYVATTGNDTTGNGSISNPYATVTKALTTISTPTTVLIHGGTYTEAVVVSKNDIIIRGYSGLAKFDHSDNLGTAFDVSGRSNITIENLWIEDYLYGVFSYIYTTKKITVENCTIISNGYDSLTFKGHNANTISIYNCTIGGNVEHGAYFANQAGYGKNKLIKNVRIENNTFYDCPHNLLDFSSNITNVRAANNYYYYTDSAPQQVATYIHNVNNTDFMFDSETWYNCGRPFENMNGQNVIVKNSVQNRTRDISVSPAIVARGYLIGGGTTPAQLGTANFIGENNSYINCTTTDLYSFYSDVTNTPGHMRNYNISTMEVDHVFGGMNSNVIENVVATQRFSNVSDTFTFHNVNALTWVWMKNGVTVETDVTTNTPSISLSNLTKNDNISAVYSSGGDFLQMVWYNDISITVSSYTPLDTTLEAINGSNVSFSANLSSSGFYEWLVNGSVVSNGTSTTASYNYTTSSIGDKNITIRTNDDQQTWIVQVEAIKQGLHKGHWHKWLTNEFKLFNSTPVNNSNWIGDELEVTIS